MASGGSKPGGKGPWVPRALKKRPNEFNVAAAAKATAAAPGPSAASASADAKAVANDAAGAEAAAAWNGAADLDELQEEEGGGGQEPKRVKAEPLDGRSAAADADASRPGADSSSALVVVKDEIVEAAPRLAAHIANPTKFVKVAAMAFSLLDAGRVTTANSHAFFGVLNAAMSDPRRMRQKEFRVAYRKLFKAACEREAIFPPETRPTLGLWRVRVLVQLDLYTDDTFQFSAAVRQVRSWLEKLPCVYPALEPPEAKHMPEEERPRWVEALFDCVEVAVMHYKYLWAKTAVDMLVRAAVDRRQNFSDEQQRGIQEWNAMCKGQKIQRQQEHARQVKEQTAYEKKEEEWRASDIKKGQGSWAKDAKSNPNLGGLDAWAAKQWSN